MTSIAVGLASGLGNAVFMLPAIKAIHLMGHQVALFVQTDFPTAALFRRCIYADEVLEPPIGLNGHRPVCGQWRPAAWSRLPNLLRFQLPYPYAQSESQSNMEAARVFGWKKEAPEVSDWCRDLERTTRWDVGIVPGSKGGTWLRKRWPGMAVVAAHFLSLGKTVAVFGLEDDGLEEIPGERVDTKDIVKLPDALAGCRVIIGTDSGVTHLASSLGVPVVAVFTATSEIKGRPLGPHKVVKVGIPCSPCQTSPRWQGCSNWRCREVAPIDVIMAAEELVPCE